MRTQDEGAKLREVSEEKLRRILDAHKTSCETGGKEGEKADLSRADLREADLQGAFLTGAKLQGADLYHADLQGANLYGVNLQKAELIGAKVDLWHARLAVKTLRRDQREAIAEAAES